MSGYRSGQRGFTLVELLCAMTVLIVLISLVGSVLFLGQKQRQLARAYADQTQQLRVAMQQLAQDLTGTRLERFRPGTQELEVVGSQPFALTHPAAGYGSTFDWNDSSVVDSSWPGDLLLLAKVFIRYSITTDGVLKREVWSDGQDAAASTQVLLTGLAPGSMIDLNNSEVTVVLRMDVGGGNRSAEVRSTFFLQQ